MTILSLYLHAAGCSSQSSVDEMPAAAVTFVDVSAQAGVDFVHTSGRSGRKYVVETMGSGAAALDYDDDGYVDLYVVNGGPLPGYAVEHVPRNALYRNLGPDAGWTFRDVAAQLAVDDDGYGMGVTVGDFDNDGDADFFVTNFGPNRLYRNDRQTHSGILFVDVAGENDVGLDTSWSTGAAFVDYDLDGDLDLYVANYLDYSFEEVLVDGARTRPRRHFAPTEYPGRRNFLYRNQDDGRFRDVTRSAGLMSVEGRQLGVLFLDYDDDGDPDLFQGNDATPNFLYRNQGDGTFVEVGLRAGVAYDESGKPEGTMGVDAGDVDGDGRQDLVMTNFQWESNTLYRALPEGGFRDASQQSGIGAPSLNRLAFGINLFDADNDGDQDLFVVNGHIDEDIGRFDPRSSYAQPDQLFLNDGRGNFRDISSVAGQPFAEAFVGRGSVVFDYDNDGDQDLFVVNSAQPAQLLRNETPPGSHWLSLRLRGTVSNRDGFGARVRVVCGDNIQSVEHRSAVSYLSQADPRLHFGLGDCGVVDSIEVNWPSGSRQVLHSVSADRILEIDEGEGVSGPLSARARRGERRPQPAAIDDTLDVATLWRQADMVLPAEVLATRDVPDLGAEEAVFDAALSSADGVAAAHLRWARALRLHRRHEDAESHYRSALDAPETRARAHVGLGQLQLSRGDFEGALASHGAAMAVDDTLASPHYYSGNLFVRSGNFEAAVRHYEEALERDSLHLRTYVNLASVHARQTDYGPAVDILRRGVEALPEHGELRYQLARVYFVQTRYDEADEQLQALLGSPQPDSEVFELLAQVARARTLADESMEWLQRGLQAHPHSGELRARLGIALVEAGAPDEALVHLEQAVRIDADRVDALYHLGRLYVQSGRSAIGELVLDLFERLQTSHRDLLDYKTAIVLNPSDAEAYYSLGAVYSRMGRLEAARQAYHAALTISPRHLNALNNLGNIYLRRRQLQQAVTAFLHVLDVDSSYVRAHHNLGTAYLLSGDPDRALAAYERATVLDPQYAPARAALARLYAELGRHQQAENQRGIYRQLTERP